MDLSLETFSTSINYKLDPIYKSALIAGINSLNWEHSTYDNDVESAFFGGTHMGIEIPMPDNAIVLLFAK